MGLGEAPLLTWHSLFTFITRQWLGTSPIHSTPDSRIGTSRFSPLELPPIGNAAKCKTGTDARSSGEFFKLPEAKEHARARHPTIHHRANLGAVLRPAARKRRGRSSPWLPP